MPIIASAKKRVRTTAKAKLRNDVVRKKLRAANKAFTQAISAGKSADISAKRAELESVIDTAAKKNIIHKNNAARKKAKASRMAKAAGAKQLPSTVKKVATKPSAKKAPAKKKPAAKKVAAKKPAAKKAPAKKATKK